MLQIMAKLQCQIPKYSRLTPAQVNVRYPPVDALDLQNFQNFKAHFFASLEVYQNLTPHPNESYRIGVDFNPAPGSGFVNKSPERSPSYQPNDPNYSSASSQV